jgi:hypothetical protein
MHYKRLPPHHSPPHGHRTTCVRAMDVTPATHATDTSLASAQTHTRQDEDILAASITSLTSRLALRLVLRASIGACAAAWYPRVMHSPYPDDPALLRTARLVLLLAVRTLLPRTLGSGIGGCADPETLMDAYAHVDCGLQVGLQVGLQPDAHDQRASWPTYAGSLHRRRRPCIMLVPLTNHTWIKCMSSVDKYPVLLSLVQSHFSSAGVDTLRAASQSECGSCKVARRTAGRRMHADQGMAGAMP